MNPIATASKLRSLRNLKGFSQEMVAEKAELNLEDYKALEMGKEPVSVDRLKKACDVLGIDFKEWFDEDDKSQVFVNNGDLKAVNVNNCESCYFYQRSEEDAEMLRGLASVTDILAERLNIEVLIREVQQAMKKGDGEEK